ncbi:Lachesin, partial [Fragariocoptes setiger]
MSGHSIRWVDRPQSTARRPFVESKKALSGHYTKNSEDQTTIEPKRLIVDNINNMYSLSTCMRWTTRITIVIVMSVSCGLLACANTPTITFITKDQIVNIGDTLELKCSIIDNEGYSIGWTRTDSQSWPRRTTTIARGTSLDVPSNRFHSTFDQRTSLYMLRIDQINENDAGTYQCQIVSGTNSPKSAKTNVFVRIPPTISDNSTRSVITSVGANLMMSCFANGFPQPTISWRRNKNELIPVAGGVAIYRGNQLPLHNVTKDDRGTYYCVADNGVSPGARRGISVEVEFRPTVHVGQPRYEQALQYDADLHCTVEAFPSPSIVWLKDGQELNDNQHYMVSVFDTSNEFSHTTLRVKKVEKKQYGTYVCRATNKFGSSEAEVQLDETPNVVCPPACDVPSYLSSSGSYRLGHHGTFFIVNVCLILIAYVCSQSFLDTKFN